MTSFGAARVGKRLSKDDPLGPHDVADRLDRAALRVWRIILLAEDAGPEFVAAVRSSRYRTNAPAECRDALARFLAEPDHGGDDEALDDWVAAAYREWDRLDRRDSFTGRRSRERDAMRYAVSRLTQPDHRGTLDRLLTGRTS